MTVSDEAAIDLLTEMLRIPSLTGKEREIGSFLLRFMEQSGFAVERDAVGNVIGRLVPAAVAVRGTPVVAARGALWASGQPLATSIPHIPNAATSPPNASPRSVLILGHMDTVPGNIPVQVRDGNLYGRGAVDAKGPLATALVAAARAAQGAKVSITVVGAVQEEGPSVGARHLLDWDPPDCLVIAEPSGWDAMVLGYKGSQRFTVEVCQPSAHTAVPVPTVSEQLVDFWNRLVAWCDQQHDVGRAVVGPARGALWASGPPTSGYRQLSERERGAARRRAGTAGAGPYPGPAASVGDMRQPVAVRSPNGKASTFDRLVPALIGMSSDSDGLEDVARMQIGLRLPPGVTLEHVRASVQALLPEARFEFQPGEIAVRGEKNTPLVAAFVRAIRAEDGSPRFKVKTGTSDMNVVGPVWRCPVLAYGPGDSRLDHTPEEHIAIDDYLRGIRVLTRALESLI